MALQRHGQLHPGPLVLDPFPGLIDELPECDQKFLAIGRLRTVSAHHGSRLSHRLLTSP
ncbi:hypothetical protein AB0M39_35015 [Streptomyces sp. NPDC051907]|uniref:hypothetical protein n=1 Tax=Streptomyces sp. NPDC051907 TaxID=3155284 RepID=UPI0034251D84